MQRCKKMYNLFLKMSNFHIYLSSCFLGHCSNNGEYYDAYPVSPMMVQGYPTVYYPMPYPVDWNGVPIPYPQMIAVPPPPQQIPHPHGSHIEEVVENNVPCLQVSFSL